MKIPYGIADFKSLRKESYLYVDKTNYISSLEGIGSKLLEDIKSILNFYIEKVKEAGQKIYLIIDEYDHFANDIIAMGDSDFYKEVIRATGFVRDFYETVKIGSKEVIDRVFITGISPVMLDDLTSGFNIAVNITLNRLVNEMLGFTEDEVKRIIEELNIDLDKEELLSELRKNYKGYLFNKDSKERLYNPDMILHSFSQWLMTGDYPDW
ncbi:AAA family ATPase [Halocella sp. SP3-1]|uniref:AAA family ATPase n=1 Tax=Halocella sp. SP3-1 TaxID=2382161 RepID=UPI00197AB590|nr:AAA family ATPase [Halocella sp. SP3-1]